MDAAKAFDVRLTADQIRDLCKIVDSETAKVLGRTRDLHAQSKHVAGKKMGQYGDRLMSILDILQPMVAALDMKDRDDASVRRVTEETES